MRRLGTNRTIPATRSERAHARLQPFGNGFAVGVAEGEYLSARLPRRPVSGGVRVDRRAGKDSQPPVLGREPGRCAVARPVVGDDDFEVVAGKGLAFERRDEAADGLAAIADGDDDAEEETGLAHAALTVAPVAGNANGLRAR